MISIVLSGTFVIEPIKYPFIFWSKSFPITFNFSFAPYNQLFQQLLDSDSMISKNAKGINVILIRGIDLDYKKENTQLFIETLMQHMRINHSRFILCICPDNKNSNESFLFEQKLISSLNEINGLQIVKSSELFSLCPFEKFYDDYCLNLGHIPYTLKAYSAIGTLICRKIYPHLH